jgi:K+-sensing histidine kinase KdpD
MRRRYIAAGVARPAACVLAVLAITAVLYALPIGDRSLLAALTLLFVVLLVSASWGFRNAIFVSFLAALGFGYLLPPVGRLQIQDSRDWFAWLAFLGTGLTVSHLSGRARTEAMSAKQAEEAARRSERELRDVIETIPAMAWTGLPDGSNAFVNRR